MTGIVILGKHVGRHVEHRDATEQHDENGHHHEGVGTAEAMRTISFIQQVLVLQYGD